MAGNGNLILKRGTTVPDNAQNLGTTTLLKGMPAVQLVGLSRTSNLAGTDVGPYAYDTYANRLWVGMDAYGSLGSNETGAGGSGGLSPMGFSSPTGAETRAIWMGAEIRAHAPVYSPGESAPTHSPTVLQVDWAHPSDLVLVTQKAIYEWASGTFGSGTSITTENDDATTTLYPVFATGTGSITPKVDTDGISYNAATDTLTLVGDLAVNGGDITTTNATATLFNTNATTVNIAGAGTSVSIGAATGTTTINNDLAVTGGDITTTSTGTATIFNTNATALNIGGGVTSGTINFGTNSTGQINIGGGTSGTVRLGTSGTSPGTVEILSGAMFSGTKTINIGTGASAGTTSVTIGSTAGTSTVALQGNATITGDLAVNGSTNADITTTTATATVFNSTATTVSVGGGATTALNLGYSGTASSSTTNINNGAHTSGLTKTVNIGTNGTTGSTTTVNIGTGLNSATGDINLGTFGATGVITAKQPINFTGGSSGGNTVQLKASSTLATDVTLTLPTTAGTNGYALTTDGSGVLGWTSLGTASSVGITATTSLRGGSSPYRMVFSDATHASGSVNSGLLVDTADDLTYDPSTNTLTVPNLTVNGTTTTVNTSNLVVSDTLLMLNSGATSNPTNDIGLIMERGSTGDNAVFIWDESADKFAIGTTTNDASTAGAVTFTTGTLVGNVEGTVNGLTVTSSTGTLTVANGKTLTASNTLTFTGTDSSSVAFGGGGTVAYTSNKLSVFAATTSSELAGVISDETGSGLLVFGTSPTFTTSIDCSSTFSAFNAASTLTIAGTNSIGNLLYNFGTAPGQSAFTKTLNIGTNGATSVNTSIRIGESTNTQSSCNVFLGCPTATITNVYVQSNRLVFGTTTSNRTILGGSATTSGTVVHTLPDVNSGNVVISGTSNFNTSGYVLVGGGSTTPAVWTDPASLSIGTASSITVRRETTGSTTKYPIPFFASNAQNNPTLTQTGNDFSSWSETATKTGYLYSDYTSQTTGSSVTDMSSGLMYQVDESGTSTTGTLYCDYIGATLDCGTYT
jgi:hypothetical protein